MGSNRGAPEVGPRQLAAVMAGALGFAVRTTPRRRTVMVREIVQAPWFGKIRRESGRAARTEWRWLQELAALGFAVPAGLPPLQADGHSLLVTAQAPGRPLDAVLREALVGAGAEAALAWACSSVAPMVRRLHDHGLCFRDLYWNHLFAVAAVPGAGEPTLIDVERVFRPRWRQRRWRVKDLAGLLSSLPAPVRRSRLLAFLRAYLGASGGGGAGGRVRRSDWKALARAVAGKAARIRAHRPRFG